MEIVQMQSICANAAHDRCRNHPVPRRLQVDGWPTDRRALALISLFGLPLVGWSALCVWTVRLYLQESGNQVITTGPGGLRIERQTRWRRRVRAELSWDQIRAVERLPFGVNVVTRDNPRLTAPNRSQDQLDEIVDVVNEYLPSDLVPWQPLSAPPWMAYLDDRGPTLIANRAERRVWPWISGADLTYATYRLARFTPRWTATPGAVVRTNNRRAGVAFEDLMTSFSPRRGLAPGPVDLHRVGVIGLELDSLWDEIAVSASMETSIPGLGADARR